MDDRPIETTVYRTDLTYPAIHADVHVSPGGVRYLRDHGIVCLAQTATCPDGLEPMLRGLDPEFAPYAFEGRGEMSDGELLAKINGQLCYLSHGPGHTTHADGRKYLNHIKEQRHGSVLQHPSITLVFYGIDRAVSHELVRHSVGTAKSQLSQRYVGPELLRYVMPKEIQGDADAEEEFFDDIERNANVFIDRRNTLARLAPSLLGETPREKRKRMQSGARRALANEAETIIGFTANFQAWRHICEQRCSSQADAAIRRPLYDALRLLRSINPIAFDDFADAPLADGSTTSVPKYSKV